MLSPYKGSNVHYMHGVKSEIHSEVSISLFFPESNFLIEPCVFASYFHALWM